MSGRSVLILGGARSGKSARALALAHPPRCLVATWRRDAQDAEMESRVRRHRAERGVGWTLFEEPLEVADVLQRESRAGVTLVIDCLTVWLANLGVAGRDPARETERLAEIVGAVEGRTVLVSNELGMGLHPETDLSRQYRDDHGRMNQRIAATVERVELVVAGQSLLVKDESAVRQATGSDAVRSRRGG